MICLILTIILHASKSNYLHGTTKSRVMDVNCTKLISLSLSLSFRLNRRQETQENWHSRGCPHRCCFSDRTRNTPQTNYKSRTSARNDKRRGNAFPYQEKDRRNCLQPVFLFWYPQMRLRTSSETKMNNSSSRSHAILTFYIESRHAHNASAPGDLLFLLWIGTSFIFEILSTFLIHASLYGQVASCGPGWKWAPLSVRGRWVYKEGDTTNQFISNCLRLLRLPCFYCGLFSDYIFFFGSGCAGSVEQEGRRRPSDYSALP